MQTKLFIFLLSLIFIFSLSDIVLVYSQEIEVKKEYWRNGKKKSEENYKGKKLDGLSTYFYENGIKMFEVFYKLGKENGLKTHWYTNGRTWYERHYKNGEKKWS